MNCCLWIMIVGQLAVSPFAAQSGDDTRVQLLHNLQGHESSISALAISPDGRLLVSASYDKTLKLWDLAAGKEKSALQGHLEVVRVIRFSPDGTLLATGSKDNTIRLWDAARGAQKSVWTYPAEPRTLSFSPDGRSLVSASVDKTITFWDVSTGKNKTIDTGHRTWVREILYSPDGKTLATNGYYNVKIWDEAGHELGTIDGELRTMCYSPDGKYLSSAIGHKLTWWEVAAAEEAAILKGREFYEYKRLDASLSPDGKTLATIDKDVAGVSFAGGGLAPFGKQRCRIVLMDVNTGEERTILEKRGSKNWFGEIWHSPDGKTLALWNWDQESITLVDPTTGTELALLTSPDGKKYKPGFLPPIAFTPDSKTLVTTYGPIIAVWAIR